MRMSPFLKILFLGLIFIPVAGYTQCTVNAGANYTDILCGEKVQLSAVGSGITAFHANFNCGQVECPEAPNYGQWAQTSSAQYNNPCNPQHPNGNPYLWFNQSSASPRILATGPLNLVNGGAITFDMRMADPDFNGNNSPCENPDSEDEGVFIQYSTDGTNWTTIIYYSPEGGNHPVRTAWTTYQANIPPATTATRVRIAQLNNTGSIGDFLDHWGVEDVTIVANPPNATYTWSHTGVPKSDGSTPEIQPTSTTTYTVTYNDGANTCTDNVTVNVSNINVSAAVDKTTVCPGDQVNLTADFGPREPAPTACAVDNNVGCRSTPSTVVMNTGGPVGYNNGNMNFLDGQASGRVQFLYTRNELLNMGLKPGKIVEVGFFGNIDLTFSDEVAYVRNFNIKLKCTNRANYDCCSNDQFEGGMNTVYSASRIDLKNGWNLFTLDKAYVWDGVSNLVVEYCHDNPNDVPTGFEIQTNDLGCCVDYVYRTTSPFSGNSNCTSSGDFGDYRRPVTHFGLCEPFIPEIDWEWGPATANFNPSNTTQNPSSNPNTTTTYEVKAKLKGAPDACYVSQTVTVNVVDVSNITPTSNSPICEGDDLQLSAGISGATYSWSGPGGFTSNQENPVITGATAANAGTYSVTVSSNGCSGSGSVEVTIVTPPNPGNPSTLSVCTNSGLVALQGLVNGEDAGGAWSDDDNSGGLNGSNFDPSAVNFSELPKTYKFTYTVSNPECGSRKSTVEVTVNKEPVAGSGSELTICSANGSVDLFDFLTGPYDNGGSWVDVDATGQVSGSSLNPSGLGGGTYNFDYTVTGVSPCTDAVARVEVTVVDPLNPGTPTDTVLCSNGDPLNLFTRIKNQDENGVWEDENGSGMLSGSVIDPTVLSNGQVPGTFYFTHKLTDLCGDQTTRVKIEVKKEAYAGTDNTLSVCAQANPVNLRPLLGTGFDTGGNWEDPDGSGQLSGSVFDPNGLGGNTYRIWYIVDGVGPCENDTAEIVVTVTQDPNTGTGSNTTLCKTSGDLDLFSLLSGNDPGGVWVDNSSSGALSGSTFKPNNLNNNLLPRDFSFIYKIDDGCTVVETEVVVRVERKPQPGSDVAKTLCAEGGAVNLNSFRPSNSDANGSWEDPGNSGALSGSTFDPTGRSGETHEIWYIVPGVAPCVPETAKYQISIIDQPDAGENAQVVKCLPADLNLITLLGGSPDNGGSWTQIQNFDTTFDVSNGFLNAPDNGSVPAGIYKFQYTISASAPCNTVSSELSIEFRDAPKITDVQTFCTPDLTGYTVTFKVAGGDENSYAVNYSGSFAADGVTYTTDPIPSNQSQTIVLSDSWGCATDQITVTKDCDCKTRAPQMDTQDTISLCGLIDVSGKEISPFNNDGDDVLAYYLHDSAGVKLGNVFAASNNNFFSFDPGTMKYGQVYYISSAAGDDDGTGFPNPLDPCYQFMPGTPVVWNKLPSISSTIDKTVICPGDEVNLTISIANPEEGPFEYAYSIGGNQIVDTSDVTSGVVVITRNPLDDTQITVDYIKSFAGCFYSPGDSYNVNVNISPRADIVTGVACSDNNPLQFDINVSGDGDSWEVVYTNDFDNTEQTLSNISAAGTSVPLTELNPNTAVTYTLVSVADNSGSICPGVTTGSFTVNPSPTAEIVNSDATYCQGAEITLNFLFTGIGPWSVDFSDNAGNSESFITDQRTYQYKFTPVLAAGSYQYNIDKIRDEITGCIGQVIGQGAQVDINPGPQAQLGFGISGNPDPNPLKQVDICVGSNQSVDFQYLSGAGQNFDVVYQFNGEPLQNLVLNSGSKSTVTIPSNLLTVGDHKLKLVSIQDQSPAACKTVDVDAVDIHVKPLPQLTISLDKNQICEGESVVFTYSVSAENLTNFEIHDANGLVATLDADPNLTDQTFTYTPASTGNYTFSIQNLKEKSVSPACSGSYQGTLNLEVVELPTAQLVGGPISICQGAVVEFDFTTTGRPDLEVDFELKDLVGGDLVETKTTPGGLAKYTFSGVAPGNYEISIVEVRDGSNAQCVNAGSGKIPVEVVANPGLITSYFETNPVCYGEGNKFNFEIQGNGPFQVDFTDGLGNNYSEQTDAQGNFSHDFIATAPTDFVITKIEDATSQTNGNSGGCVAQNMPATESLQVNPLPGLKFTGSDLVCSGENAVLQLNAFGSDGPFTVYFNDKLGGKNFTKAYVGYGDLAITTIDYNGFDSLELHPLRIVDNLTGCEGNIANGRVADYATVVVKPIPAASFSLSEFGGCAPLDIQAVFKPSDKYDDRVENWTWSLNQLANYQDEDTLDLRFTDQGSTHELTLNFKTIHGCQAIPETKKINVYVDPVAEFSYSPEKPTTLNYQVRFTEETLGAIDYEWAIEKDSILHRPTFFYDFPHDTEGYYEVCLNAVSAYGCMDTICKSIFVEGEIFAYFPTAFTPNNDGINDTWKPSLTQVIADDFRLEIFNRWGELIYASEDPEVEWDGVTKLGELAPDGVYVYRLFAKPAYKYSFDILEKGSITLLR
ncbi:T9SS type B sorting domain-containing protein [Luteibaculum oceani]|uniref:T9SS type B sorting domain-containing protein n=1 Tax=Luteibaculum oceani TaxID=1294296 RepID=A0A5C6VET6_9FLAO|nr:gliding motility-associated C-terminal domain-containing protein [Luteibaculum oceani]TXC81688.1 T9SS type B sorting domain-containing protein [Luteibaculum oceani]